MGQVEAPKRTKWAKNRRVIVRERSGIKASKVGWWRAPKCQKFNRQLNSKCEFIIQCVHCSRWRCSGQHSLVAESIYEPISGDGHRAKIECDKCTAWLTITKCNKMLHFTACHRFSVPHSKRGVLVEWEWHRAMCNSQFGISHEMK